ncbi:MAG: PepSY-associated TM helix domain-containing protein [Acidimicrobiales bacterium]
MESDLSLPQSQNFAPTPGAIEVDPIPAGAPTATGYGPDTAAGQASRLWRSVWRVHFYAGMLSMPFLILFALTGLVILYTDPINEFTQARWRASSESAPAASLESQRQAVEGAYPDSQVLSVTPPRHPAQTTAFSLADAEGNETIVYVDPAGAEVRGAPPGGLRDVVGLANRLHGSLNNSSLTIAIPSIAGVINGDDAVMVDVPLSEVILEVMAVWGLTMAASGIYLWWPRKPGTGKALFLPRRGKRGRPRWRDLHAVAGVALSGLIVFFVTSGLPWSTYWGGGWGAATEAATPNRGDGFYDLVFADAQVASALPRVGDLDRDGTRIPWASRRDPLPNSAPPTAGQARAADDPTPTPQNPTSPAGNFSETVAPGSASARNGDLPAPVSLDRVAAAATAEGVPPGASIYLPRDTSLGGQTSYGSFAVVSPSPGRMNDQGAVFIDQFSARTISVSNTGTYGALQWLTEFGVQTHLGTQFGLASRVTMTAGCLLILWMAFTGLVMWAKRRPQGRMGLPRRPADVRTPRPLRLAATGLGLVYPLWGVSALAVLSFDRLVIRRVPRLRSAFGMRSGRA